MGHEFGHTESNFCSFRPDRAVDLLNQRDYCIECFKCTEACGERQAIDFNQKPEEVEFDVGAIIVSTGFDIYLPYDMPLLGYGKYPNVITSMEFERLILSCWTYRWQSYPPIRRTKTTQNRLHPMCRQPRQNPLPILLQLRMYVHPQTCGTA